MQTIDQIVTTTIVSLIRSVPWGQSRESLETKAESLSREAAYENGWDNHSTAHTLRWEADMYRLAAEARTPRDGDKRVNAAKSAIKSRLHDIVSLKEDYYDEGELIEVNRDEYWTAVMRAIRTDDDADFTIIDTIIDEFEATGKIENGEELKQMHRGEANEECFAMRGP